MHDEKLWNFEMNEFLRKRFSRKIKLNSIFTDSFYDVNSIDEREKFEENSQKLLKSLQDVKENFPLKDIDSVLSELGNLKLKVRELEKEKVERDEITRQEQKINFELKTFMRENNIRADEPLTFTLIDLIMAVCSSIAFEGNSFPRA